MSAVVVSVANQRLEVVATSEPSRKAGERHLDRPTEVEGVLRRQLDRHLLDTFADFDDLQRAGLRMRLDPAALGQR